MMFVQTQPITLAAFDNFINLPENADRMFELIGGEMVEVTPSNLRSSHYSVRISSPLHAFVSANDLGFVTGEAGGYSVAGERYAPDVAFLSKARQGELTDDAYNPLAPDLAVEIISPTDREDRLRIKISNYLAAGTVVWVVNPKNTTVEVHTPGKPVKILGIDDTLDGGELLPGFTLPVKMIFPA